MKLSVLPFGVAALMAAALPAVAQEPAPSPSPSAEPPRYREVVEVQGDLPAVSGPALGVTKVALDLEDTPSSVSVVPAHGHRQPARHRAGRRAQERERRQLGHRQRRASTSS